MLDANQTGSDRSHLRAQRNTFPNLASRNEPKLCRNSLLGWASASRREVGMAGLIEGVNRSQTVLFPVRMEKYINEDSFMRVVDPFVVAARAPPSRSADKSLDTLCAAIWFRLRTILLSLGVPYPAATRISNGHTIHRSCTPRPSASHRPRRPNRPPRAELRRPPSPRPWGPISTQAPRPR